MGAVGQTMNKLWEGVSGTVLRNIWVTVTPNNRHYNIPVLATEFS